MTDSPTDRRLTVRGHGRSSLPADAADVVLGVEIVRATAGEARDAAAAAMTDVVAAVRAAGAGVGDGDLRTTDLALSPEIEYRPDGTQRRVGFRLVNRITVRLADPAAVATVVDAAVGAGATSLDGVSFHAREAAAAREAALAAAVEDARGAAEALARAAGASLGAVRSIREGDGFGPVPSPRMAMLEAKVADTPVLPGTTEIVATVEVTWDLAPASTPDRAG